MPCSICGANCRCKKRAHADLCCSCHKHKPRKSVAQLLAVDHTTLDRNQLDSLFQHLDLAKAYEKTGPLVSDTIKPAGPEA